MWKLSQFEKTKNKTAFVGVKNEVKKLDNDDQRRKDLEFMHFIIGMNNFQEILECIKSHDLIDNDVFLRWIAGKHNSSRRRMEGFDFVSKPQFQSRQ